MKRFNGFTPCNICILRLTLIADQGNTREMYSILIAMCDNK